MIRIAVQQPGLRTYRIPFYREWAARDGIALRLFYAYRGDGIPDADLETFDSRYVPMRIFRIGGKTLMWHSAQWRNAASDACDVLVLSWNAQYLSLVPSLLRARKNGIRTILWGHGYSKQESRLRKSIRDAVARLGDALVFYDGVTAQSFLDGGWPKDRIFTAPNSLDQQEIQSAAGAWSENREQLLRFREERGLQGSKNILYIGRVYAENRLDLLIDALPVIRNKHPEARVVVIGQENDLTRTLQEQAHKLGVGDALHWAGAVFEEQQIAPYMLSSCLFCYPANIGLSIMHASGYGLPVITGDCIERHNPEIHMLRNGENGCLFSEGDAQDLAGRIVRLLNDPEQLAAMGACARKTVQDGFTTPHMVDGFMDAVKAVTGE